jgi:hypothetical protein
MGNAGSLFTKGFSVSKTWHKEVKCEGERGAPTSAEPHKKFPRSKSGFVLN